MPREDREDRNHLDPKNKWQSLLAAFYGGGAASGGVVADAASADAIDPSTLKDTSVGMSADSLAANDAPVLGPYTPASSVPPPNLGKRPGFWQNLGVGLLTKGQNIPGLTYDKQAAQLKSLLYEGQVREALQNEAKQAALNQIKAQHGYVRDETKFKTDEGIRGAGGETMAKLGMTTNDAPILGNFNRAKLGADTQQEGYRGEVLGSPQGAQDYQDSILAGFKAPGLKNAETASITGKNNWRELSSGVMGFDANHPEIIKYNTPVSHANDGPPIGKFGPTVLTPEGNIISAPRPITAAQSPALATEQFDPTNIAQPIDISQFTKPNIFKRAASMLTPTPLPTATDPFAGGMDMQPSQDIQQPILTSSSRGLLQPPWSGPRTSPAPTDALLNDLRLAWPRIKQYLGR